MRKISFVVFAFFMFVQLANAQSNDYKNEIRLSFSDGSPLNIGMALGSSFGSVFTNRKITSNSGTGSWALGYRNHVTNRVSVGADISFQRVKNEFEHKNGSQNSQEISYATVMPAIDFNYYRNNNGNVLLYGTLMAGVGLLNSKTTQSDPDLDDKDNSTIAFAFQVNPIGIRVGKQVAGFAELGAGTRGFVTLGLSASF